MSHLVGSPIALPEQVIGGGNRDRSEVGIHRIAGVPRREGEGIRSAVTRGGIINGHVAVQCDRAVSRLFDNPRRSRSREW